MACNCRRNNGCGCNGRGRNNGRGRDCGTPNFNNTTRGNESVIFQDQRNRVPSCWSGYAYYPISIEYTGPFFTGSNVPCLLGNGNAAAAVAPVAEAIIDDFMDDEFDCDCCCGCHCCKCCY